MMKIVLPKERVRRVDSLEYVESMNYINFECSAGNLCDGIRKNGKESITFNYETDLETYEVSQLVVVTFGEVPESWLTDYSDSTDEIEVLEVRDFTVDDFDKITDNCGTYLKGENDEDWFSNVIE